VSNLDAPFRAPAKAPIIVMLDWMRVPLEGEALRTSLNALVRTGLESLPKPGKGRTLERWRMLAAVAERDLSLVKLFEGHVDALAILSELHGPALPVGATCGTWASESSSCRLELAHSGNGRSTLSGRKQWCSGAPMLSHALVTAWQGDVSRLALVQLGQPGVTVTRDGWNAVGMKACTSVDVIFDAAEAVPVGHAGSYLHRPGFWHGGAGIAACWYGGACSIAQGLFGLAKAVDSPFLKSNLGQVAARLTAARAALAQAAAWIDAQPEANAERIALEVRTLIEQTAREVIELAGRSLGAFAYCKDPGLSQRLADLPVYLSQSHAERDWQRLGTFCVESGIENWSL